MADHHHHHHSTRRRYLFLKDTKTAFVVLCTIIASMILLYVEPVQGNVIKMRVCSWNLLAQEYIKEYKYPWLKQSPEYLEWEYRKSLIVDTLLQQQHQHRGTKTKTKLPDVVCIQEAQVDLFSDLLASLTPEFYGVIQNVSSSHNVGTAVLIRNSCPVRIKRIESRSRALIVTLEDKKKNTKTTTNSNNLLYLCSVHLDADRSFDPKERKHHQDQRRNQLKSLLKRINYHCKLDDSSIQDAPILVAGDFNMLRENPLHASLTEGSVSPSAPVPLHDAYMEDELQQRRSIPLYHHNDDNNNNDMRTKAKNNDNGNCILKQLQKTYKGGAILDYIWTSKKIKVVHTLLYHPGATSLSREQWPSKTMPSDHLPIGIDIEWN